MADDPKPNNFANNSIILAALFSTGALIFHTLAPLQDERPVSKEPQVHETASAQDVEARLWQDPFSVVAKAEAEADAKAKAGMKADPAWQGVLRRDRDGRPGLTETGQATSFHQNRLRELLAEAADEVEGRTGQRFTGPTQATGRRARQAPDGGTTAARHPPKQTRKEEGRPATFRSNR